MPPFAVCRSVLSEVPAVVWIAAVYDGGYSVFLPWRSSYLTPDGHPPRIEPNLLGSPRTGIGAIVECSGFVRQHRTTDRDTEPLPRSPVAHNGLAEPSLEEALDQKGIEIDIPHKSEVSGVDEVDIDIYEVDRIRQSAGGPEKRVVPAPSCMGGCLGRAKAQPISGCTSWQGSCRQPCERWRMFLRGC